MLRRSFSNPVIALLAAVALSWRATMTNMTDYLEGQILAHIHRTATFTKPTVLAVALYTAAPGEVAGTGTEVTGGSYARVSINPLDANWAAPVSGDGHTENVGAITFPAPTASWGTINSFQILDATSAGNGLLYGSLTVAKTVNNGDAAPSFAAGALDVTYQ
jgi:hypothetical protein